MSKEEVIETAKGLLDSIRKDAKEGENPNLSTIDKLQRIMEQEGLTPKDLNATDEGFYKTLEVETCKNCPVTKTSNKVFGPPLSFGKPGEP